VTLRILTQVNYSAGENTDGDSGLRFTSGLLAALLRRSELLHFYVLVPEHDASSWIEALPQRNVTPITVDLPPRLHGGDFRFDAGELYDRFDFRSFDIDVLFVNRPETVAPILNFLNRQTFHNVRCVSYVHWLDTRRPSTPKQGLHLPALLSTISGLVSSTYAVCNSRYAKVEVLKEAGRWFKEDVVSTLDDKLRILPPGLDVHELVDAGIRRRSRQARILINHRVLKYTGVRSLLTRDFPRLWEIRKDFHVTVTNPTRVRLPGVITQAPWMTVSTMTRPDYIRALRTHDIVVGPHRNTHWSMSTLEAIAAGCVPLMNVESFFPEMMEPILARLTPEHRQAIRKGWFYYRGGFIPRMAQLLDSLDVELARAKTVSEIARAVYSWDRWTDEWLSLFSATAELNPMISPRTPSMARILEAIKEEGALSKHEILKRMRWAPKQRALSWTAYRRTLLGYTYDSAYESDVVYKWNGDPGAREQ
jgi:hypothetical protein